MSHKDWCGKLCEFCEEPCSPQNASSCPLNCEHLRPDGSRNTSGCRNCAVLFNVKDAEQDTGGIPPQKAELDTDQILSHYRQEDKPACFNYALAREHVQRLCHEYETLHARIAALEQAGNEICSALEKAGIRPARQEPDGRAVIEKISRFLQDAGFEGAAKAVDCQFEL